MSKSRNAAYEQRRRDDRLVKITVWVPEDAESHFKELANHCVDHRDLYPVACRSMTTGRLSFIKG